MIDKLTNTTFGTIEKDFRIVLYDKNNKKLLGFTLLELHPKAIDSLSAFTSDSQKECKNFTKKFKKPSANLKYEKVVQLFQLPVEEN